MSEMSKFVEQNQSTILINTAIDTFAQVGTKHLDRLQTLLDMVQPTHLNIDQYHSYRFAGADCDSHWQYGLGRLLFNGVGAHTWFNNCRSTFLNVGSDLLTNIKTEKLKRLGFKMTLVKKMTMRHDELVSVFEELFDFSRCLKGIGTHEDLILHTEGKFESTNLKYVLEVFPMTTLEIRRWFNSTITRPFSSLQRDTLNSTIHDFEPLEGGSILQVDLDTFIDNAPFEGLLDFLNSAEKLTSSSIASIFEFVTSGKV